MTHDQREQWYEHGGPEPMGGCLKAVLVVLLALAILLGLFALALMAVPTP